MTNFPAQPEDLSAGWITKVLRASGELAQTNSVSGFSVDSIGDGMSMVCRVMRVRLNYRSENGAGPASLVMKFAHNVEANRKVGKSLRVYEREATFYNKVASLVTVPKPHCVFADWNPETDDAIVVMEDLGALRAVDQVDGASAEDVQHIIDAVSPLHVTFWQGAVHPFPEAAARIDGAWCEQYSQIVDGTWENCISQFPEFVPGEIQTALPEYTAQFRNLHQIIGDGPVTLLHGDPRIDNVLFRHRGANISEAVMLDWQTLMVSNPLHDLALVLSMSVPVDTRRAVETDLVRSYHTRLTDAGIRGYSQERCFEDYDLALLYLLSVAVVIGGAYDPANTRGRRLAEEVLTRASTAVLDRDLLRLLPAST